MLSKISLVYILMCCTIGAVIEIGYFFYKKNNKDILDLDLKVQPTRIQIFKRKFEESKFSQAYIKYLNTQLNLTFNEKETASIIYHRQQVLTGFGLLVFIGSFFIFPKVVSLVILVGFLIGIFYPNLNFYKINQDKAHNFDKTLPVFISKVLLTLKVGMNLENALAYGVNSIDHPLVKKEFEKLMVDIRLYPDSISTAFVNLRKRVVGSQECEKFANIVVSGLKNGNPMQTILEQEMERISEKQIKEVREEQEKKTNFGMALTIITIFIPALLLFLIPLMSTGGMQ